jgi:hypothetical protein
MAASPVTPVTRLSRRRATSVGLGAAAVPSTVIALLQGFFITASQQTTHSSAIPSGVLLFVEDHLATIEDLDAVKAYGLASTVDPPIDHRHHRESLPRPTRS